MRLHFAPCPNTCKADNVASINHLFPGGFDVSKLPPAPPLLPPDAQLRVALAEAGLTPPAELIFDGQIHRFKPDGKKDASGWYVAYEGKVPAGAFGDWRAGVECTWRADIGRELSHAESMQHAARMRELKLQREKELTVMREDAAQTASSRWESAPLASDEHPYLQRKGITNPGLRVASDGRLMAPMFIGSEMVSLQMIAPDGEKRFLKGGKTGGAWWMVGGIDASCQRVYLAEGVATAASIFEATGKPVAIAYSAGNMAAVAEALRQVVGMGCEVVIVADNDASGTGMREAIKAADAIGARVVMPPAVGDANDYAQAGGDLMALLEPVATVQHRYKLTPAHQLTDLPPVRWQIKKILPSRDVAAIYGAPGAGKSFMALDMAASIAEGRDWMGYRTKPAQVVYVVLEAANGFSGRLKAWQMHHKRQLPGRFNVITHTPLALSSPKDLIDLMESIRAVVGADHGGMVLFIDTLARAMGAFEENSNDDMSRVIAACDALSKGLQCTVVTVAHPGKDSAKGMRGGSALLGGLDTVIQLEKDAEGIRTWKIEKQKEGEDGLSGSFKLHVIPVGEDEDGEEITSAVVIESEETSSENIIERESDAIYKARKLFEDAVISVGRINNDTAFISADAWNEYTKTIGFATDESRRQTLARAKKNLVKAGYICEVRGGYEATENPVFAGAFLGL